MNLDKVPNMNKERIYWIDSAKGIGVVLIIAGHLLYQSDLDWLLNLIYSFHVPLFFILAGITYNRPNKHQGRFLYGKAVKLLLPFICYTIMSILLDYNEIKKESLQNSLSGLFYLNGEMIYNRPLWFLIVLFGVYCIAVISRVDNERTDNSVIVAVISFVLGWVFYTFREGLPFLNILGINRAIICFGFFIVGRVISKLKTSALLAVSSGILCIAIALINGRVSIYRYELSNYPLLILTGLLGSISFIQLTKMLFDVPGVLGRISKYSILYLGTQYMWIVPFREIVSKLGLKGVFPQYDAIAIVLMMLYIVAIPPIYILISKKIKFISILNGESIMATKN